METLTAIALGYKGPFKELFVFLGVILALAAGVWTVLRKERQYFQQLEAERSVVAREAADMRQELRTEIDRLRGLIDDLETKVDSLEGELHTLRDRNLVLERAVRQHGLNV